MLTNRALLTKWGLYALGFLLLVLVHPGKHIPGRVGDGPAEPLHGLVCHGRIEVDHFVLCPVIRDKRKHLLFFLRIEFLRTFCHI